MELQGRIAVVTGGTTGIGRASLQALEKEGARVVNWDITDEADVRVDVTKPEDIDAAIAWTVANVGVPTLLVTSAGVGYAVPFNEQTVESWNRVIDINLRGTFLSVQAVTREMVKAKLDGSIVLIASINGILADPQTLAYSVAKAGVIQMAKVVANEFGPDGIRVNAICPGPTETPMMAHHLENDTYRKTIADSTALRAVGTAEQVAEVVVGTMKLDWITGQPILADGGATLVTARGAARNALNAFENP
ncbi:MAG: dehydrogenase, short-chain alcohol dehydrogenase like protein [Nocardioidaceae bacterium]|nr:dehydrogenase, short-chain alcohol dehydrogenase like protein [Nocardioidaceae bacterium]